MISYKQKRKVRENSLYKKTIKEMIKRGFDKKPFRFTKVVDNDFYKSFIEEFKKYYGLGVITGEYNENFMSMVEMDNHYRVIDTSSFMIRVMNVSNITLIPNEEGGIYINRFNVSNTGSGIGTLTMISFLNVLVETIKSTSQVPYINLEVLPNVGLGANKKNVDMVKAVKFYSKFGFKVVDYDRNYIKMVLDIDRAIEVQKEFSDKIGIKN
ncbi:hypothetical protein [Flavobacterium sp.]|uniref:hypothetical protein n=1 Tax=Flavobacterium sp. TaxID=239 RepID=UPI002FDE1334